MADLSDLWKDYLSKIYRKGHFHVKDDGDEIRELLGVHFYIERPQDCFLFGLDSKEKYLDLIGEGVFNIQNYFLKDYALFEYVNSWNDESLYDGGDFVYTYPERLFNIHTYDKYDLKDSHINQYEVMIHRLKEYDGSNRAVATLYNAGLDKNEQHIPCLNFLQAIVRDEKLTLVCMFRSNDIFSAWPSNMMLLTHLGLMLAEELNVKFVGIDYHCSSAHYYMSEEPIIEELFKWSRD